MFKRAIAAVAAGLAVSAALVAGPVTAEDAATGDVRCSDLSLSLTAPPSQAVATLTVTAQTLLQQCHSLSGSALSLVTPGEALSISLEAHTSETHRFVAENARGEQASARLIVVRQ